MKTKVILSVVMFLSASWNTMLSAANPIDKYKLSVTRQGQLTESNLLMVCYILRVPMHSLVL